MSDGFVERGLTAEAIAGHTAGVTAGQAAERLLMGRSQQGSEASSAVSVAPASGADDALLRGHALVAALLALVAACRAVDRDRRRCVAERRLRVCAGVSRRSGWGKTGRPAACVGSGTSRRSDSRHRRCRTGDRRPCAAGAGDRVSADMHVLSAEGLAVDESMLTGESALCGLAGRFWCRHVRRRGRSLLSACSWSAAGPSASSRHRTCSLSRPVPRSRPSSSGNSPTPSLAGAKPDGSERCPGAPTPAALGGRFREGDPGRVPVRAAASRPARRRPPNLTGWLLAAAAVPAVLLADTVHKAVRQVVETNPPPLMTMLLTVTTRAKSAPSISPLDFRCHQTTTAGAPSRGGSVPRDRRAPTNVPGTEDQPDTPPQYGKDGPEETRAGCQPDHDDERVHHQVDEQVGHELALLLQSRNRLFATSYLRDLA